jgi:beta-lactamase regulating signal transducer with metallopeptidase domain
MTFLMDSTIKVSIVVGVALLATMFLRRRSAAVRHWVLSSAVLCAALVPAGTMLLPPWSISAAASQTVYVPALTRSSASVSALPGPAAVPEPRTRLSWGLMIWLAGAGLSLFVLALGYGRLLRAERKSEIVTDGEWLWAAENISQQYNLRRRVRLLRGQSPAMLVTWGSLRPRILLPAGCDGWPAERMQVVLQHEMAHVRRNDWLMHTVAELVRVVFWFNPLLWIACRRLRLESEYAADDAVLAQGISGARYATHLLEIVRMLQQPDRAWSAASAMARPSTIERRFSAMLNSTIDRRLPGTVIMAAVTIVVLGLSLSLAALSGAAPVPAVVAAMPAVPRPAVESPRPPIKRRAPSPAAAPQTAPQTQYKGELISLDLENADIKDFLRLIADIGGLSLILDGAVTGNITVQLKQIPWDQALQIVANNKQLGVEINGKVLLVSSKQRPASPGPIALDFEVFKNGRLLGSPRITTVANSEATIGQGEISITVTPTEVAANKLELKLSASVSGEKITVRMPVSKDTPGILLWESRTDRMEIRVTLASGF